MIVAGKIAEIHPADAFAHDAGRLVGQPVKLRYAAPSRDLGLPWWSGDDEISSRFFYAIRFEKIARFFGRDYSIESVGVSP